MYYNLFSHPLLDSVVVFIFLPRHPSVFILSTFTNFSVGYFNVYNNFPYFPVKKVTNERVSDDPAESVSARISDAEGSQKDTQTVEEEQQSLTLSAQDSEQNVVEQDQNQKKRRRKNQGEGGKREVKSLSGNASVQPGSSKGEKHTSKFITYFNGPYITCKDMHMLYDV